MKLSMMRNRSSFVQSCKIEQSVFFRGSNKFDINGESIHKTATKAITICEITIDKWWIGNCCALCKWMLRWQNWTDKTFNIYLVKCYLLGLLCARISQLHTISISFAGACIRSLQCKYKQFVSEFVFVHFLSKDIYYLNHRYTARVHAHSVYLCL